jgi:hypothetical protein
MLPPAVFHATVSLFFDPRQRMHRPLPTATVKRLLPWLVAVAFFMESLDTTILNTAVPTIAGPCTSPRSA